MAKQAIARIITTLVKNNVTLGIYTNNLAAYDKLRSLVPPTMHSQIVSYPTVQRKVKKCGDFYDVPTPVGIFTISKEPLYRFHEQKETKEIAPGQSATVGTDTDSNAM